MKETKAVKFKRLAYEIIQNFPKSKNKQPYLVMKSGKKLFFSRFIKKYGLDGRSTQYSDEDFIRRIRTVEFFKYFLKECDLQPARDENKLLLDSTFHRMVILNEKLKNGRVNKLELLSFYPK